MTTKPKAEPPVVMEPILDEILPLRAGWKKIPLKNGEGKETLDNRTPRVVELPYRAFEFLWEFAERRAEENYPKYAGGPMDNVAQAHLEAVVAFRNAAYDMTLDVLDPSVVALIREKGNSLPEGAECRSCSGRLLIAVHKNGKPMWRCLDCRKRTPRKVARKTPTRASKALEAPAPSKDAPKTQPKRRGRSGSPEKVASKTKKSKRSTRI